MPTGLLIFDDGSSPKGEPLRAANSGAALPGRGGTRSAKQRLQGRFTLLTWIGFLRILVGSLVVIGVNPTLATPGAIIQDIDDETFADRPISEVEFKGLDRVEIRLVQNNIRTASGQPFEAQSLRDDVATLYRLGQFQTVTADAVLQPDGSVKVIYRVTEQSIIRDVQTVGNTLVSDQELRAQIPLYAGGPRDDFLVEQSLLRIKNLYRGKGHYLAEVLVEVCVI